MTRVFSILPGKRDALPLFIGLVGPSSSGKTRSAFELAAGIQLVVGGDIVFINTEGRRGLLDIDLFQGKIKHMPFQAPYASLDYLAAIETAKQSGAKTIIIDSLSHEHEAEGGMLDSQDQELRRLAGDDYGTWKAERFNMLAWQKPKADRRKLLVRGIMQSEVNLIACFRAKHTSKPVKVDGKTKVVDMGFMPIAGEEFVFEMSLCAFLPPNSKGVPDWSPEAPGERMAVKRNDQLAEIVPDGAQLSQEIGKRLAVWAQGTVRAPTDLIDDYAVEVGKRVKEMAVDDLARWWAESSQRRLDLNIPAARLKKMEAAVMKVLNPEGVA